MFNKYEFDTGLRVLIEPMQYVRSVTIGVWIKSGSRFEPNKKHGISHLLEHMLFKGSCNRSAKAIAEEVDQIGGQINAMTSKEYTCIYMKVMDHHLERALNILADMYFNSIFAREDLEKEQQVVIEELKMYEDIPDEYVHDLILQSCYKNHGLAHNILGERESVLSIEQKDLIDHYRHFFTADNTVIAISGNVDPEETYKQVGNLFNAYFDVKNNLGFPYHPVEPKYQTDVLNKNKETEQTHLCLAFPGINLNDNRIYQLSVLNNIIGGSMSSRLFQEIREQKGLCYSIFSYQLNFLDSGLFIIYAGFSSDYYQRTYDLMWDILGKVKQNPVSCEELNRAKEQVKGHIIMGMESTSNRMARLGKDELLKGEVKPHQEIIDAIDRVETDQILELAREIFVEHKESKAVISPEIDESKGQ